MGNQLLNKRGPIYIKQLSTSCVESVSILKSEGKKGPQI